MVKTRVGIFETNSSSTHCLSLGDIAPAQTFPDSSYNATVVLGDGEYGWEYNDYDSWLDKADYLALLTHQYCDSCSEKIVEQAILRKYPSAIVEFNFTGYIDHGDEYVEQWMKDVDEVFKFIFGDGTFSTSNDNY